MGNLEGNSEKIIKRKRKKEGRGGEGLGSKWNNSCWRRRKKQFWKQRRRRKKRENLWKRKISSLPLFNSHAESLTDVEEEEENRFCLSKPLEEEEEEDGGRRTTPFLCVLPITVCGG